MIVLVPNRTASPRGPVAAWPFEIEHRLRPLDPGSTLEEALRRPGERHLHAVSIAQPVLVVEYTGDQACFPGDVRRIVDAIASTDKRHLRVRGDHHGRALAPDEEPGRLEAGRLLAQWLREQFPS